jgi:hypothetical protein
MMIMMTGSRLGLTNMTVMIAKLMPLAISMSDSTLRVTPAQRMTHP